MSELQWQSCSFADLDGRVLYAMLAARQQVFIVEQNCPYLDADGADPHCAHLTAWRRGEIAAYARLVPPGLKFAEASIGRVLTTSVGRGQGLGRALMLRALSGIEQAFGDGPVRIGAQQYLDRFYQSLGFNTMSPSYLEDGIPHVEMLKN